MGRALRLELENFKSYGGRQTVSFLPFTCIVGPNGAGKSNLMDALSFVLGVRAAHLRGTQLKDLIHRPAPAAGGVDAPAAPLTCSVTLVYETDEAEREAAVAAGADELDAAELHFSRTITARRGAASSKYRLQGREASWEAYDGALRRLGLLVKARNFLVFQGDVESVASSSGKALTALLESVSGSDALAEEYDRLAEEKSAAEDATIFRFQTQKSVRAEARQVREQKEEAERWEETRESLGALRTEWFLWRLFHLGASGQTAAKKLAGLRRALSRAEGRAERVRADVDARKREAATAHRKAVEVEKKVAAARRAVEAAAPRSIATKEEARHLTARLEEKNAEFKRLGEEAQAAEAELNGLEADIARLKAALAEVEAEEASGGGDGSGGGGGSGDDGDSALTAEQAAEYERLQEEAAAKTAELRAEHDALQRQQKTDEAALAVHSAEDRDLRAEADALAEQAKNYEARASKVEASLAETAELLAALEAERQQLEAEEAADIARRAELAEELRTVEGELRDMGDVRARSSRAEASARLVDTLKRLFPGVRGRLRSLCRPSQRRFQRAVRVALGRELQAIVVDDEETAFECVKYMRSTGSGTATFLPLNKVRTKPPNERLRRLGSAFRLALDVIDFEAALQPALLYAVGDTVIADSLADARDLSFRRSMRCKVVTLRGHVISPSGVMTGGRMEEEDDGGDGSAAAWDTAEAAALFERKTATRTRLLREQVALESRIGTRGRRAVGSGRRRQLIDLDTKMQGLHNRQKYSQMDVSTSRDTLAKTRSKQASCQDALDELAPKLARLEAALASRRERLASLTASLHSTEDEVFADFAASLGVRNVREWSESRLAQARARAERKRKLTEQLAALQAAALYNAERDLTTPMEQAGKEAKEAATRLKTLRRKEKKEHAKLAKAQAALEAETPRLEEAEAAADAADEAVKAVQRMLRKATSAVSTKRKAITAEETAAERLRAQLHELLQKARVEQVTLPQLADGEQGDWWDDAEGDEDDEDGSGKADDGGHASASDSDADEDGTEATPHFSQSASVAVRRDRQLAARLDFSALPDERRVALDDEAYASLDGEYRARVTELTRDLELAQPNLKALDRFADVSEKLRGMTKELDSAKERARAAVAAYNDVRQRRFKLFMEAFRHVEGCIDAIYKDLTRSTKHRVGGTAYLTLEDAEEPYGAGVKYTAMPPMKRFRDMEQLSGGEKTVAALALLFAIHSYRPAPFFVMDEIDAALDNVNVNKVSSYIRRRCGDFQCIVISLKDSFFEKADGLVGIYRDADCSKSVTLDLRDYDDDDAASAAAAAAGEEGGGGGGGGGGSADVAAASSIAVA